METNKSDVLLKQKKTKIFYGYWIVLAAFFCVFTNSIGTYHFSLFISPLQAQFNWDRGSIMMAFTLYFLITGFGSSYIGRLLDRYGARKIVLIGGIVNGASYVLLSQVNSIWYLYGGYLMAGIGMAAMGIVPASYIVSHWFNKRRGLAVGIMSAGIGAGGIFIVPLTGIYLIPNFGFRMSYIVMAVLIWIIIIPLALFVIKPSPVNEDGYMKQKNNVEHESANKSPLPTSDMPSVKNALLTFSFWFITISYFFHGFSQMGIIQTQVPHLNDIGFSMPIAATALGTVAFVSTASKLMFGWLCDRMPAKYACVIGLCLQLVATMILLQINSASPAFSVWAYAILFGLGTGSWLPTMSMIISTCFGLTSYGTIFSLVHLAENIGVATGPLIAGYIFNIFDSYYYAFILFFIVFIVSLVTILFVRRPNLHKIK